MKIIIPMCGEGKRFKEAGYDKPKPLIDVFGKPMIDLVINSLPKADFIFPVNNKEIADYLKDKGEVIFIDKPTEGAVCTVLKAEDKIEGELLIANCDQYVDFNMDEFSEYARKSNVCIMIFNSTNPHHSYVKVKDGRVTQTAEKQVISDKAIVGIYYFKNGKDFVEAAHRVIDKNIRVNNEFYISSVFNEMKDISVWEIDVNKKHILGTPTELQIFIDKVNNGEVIL